MYSPNQSPKDTLPTQKQCTLWDEEEKRINLLKNQPEATTDGKRYQQQRENAQNRLLLFQSIECGLTTLIS